jgi:hypothetical protein
MKAMWIVGREPLGALQGHEVLFLFDWDLRLERGSFLGHREACTTARRGLSTDGGDLGPDDESDFAGDDASLRTPGGVPGWSITLAEWSFVKLDFNDTIGQD